MRLKTKNGSHRYDINRPRQRQGDKYTKYKMCLGIIMVICIKQHLSNIWSSICETIKQHWGWIEKTCCFLKKACISLEIILWNFKELLTYNINK